MYLSIHEVAAALPKQARDRGEVLLYRSEDGDTRVEVRFEGQTAWLSTAQMSELFQRDKSVICRHVRNIFADGELVRSAAAVTRRPSTAADGKTYQVEYFSLDVILAVGYRVRSRRGAQFRAWATQRLREYLLKGFTLDDGGLRRRGGGDYFDELLDRLRDLRSSEKAFWRKVLDIYATSVDYDPRAAMSQEFFRTVQNKLHWAAHGHTAAEIIATRADAGKPNMGLTSWAGASPKKTDIGVAKNYLAADELRVLERIVSAFLELAELQAQHRRPMYMADWMAKLDGFLALAERPVLPHRAAGAGDRAASVGDLSHDEALARARSEYERFAAARAELPAPPVHCLAQAKSALAQRMPLRRGQPRRSRASAAACR